MNNHLYIGLGCVLFTIIVYVMHKTNRHSCGCECYSEKDGTGTKIIWESDSGGPRRTPPPTRTKRIYESEGECDMAGTRMDEIMDMDDIAREVVKEIHLTFANNVTPTGQVVAILEVLKSNLKVEFISTEKRE